MLLFQNNRLLFSLLFSETFCGGEVLDGGDKVVMGRLLFSYCFLEIFVGWDKALMEGDKVVTGGSPSTPSRENPVG